MKIRFGLVLAMVLGATVARSQSSFAGDVLALGPLGYWRLDGNAVDATLHASNGGPINGLTFTGPGGGAPIGDPLNAAASLIGAQSQYISIGAGEPALGTLFDLDLTHPFSMMIWVKTNYTAHDMFLLAKAENVSPFRGFGLVIDNGDTPGSSPKNAGRFGLSLSDGPNDFVLVDTLTSVTDGNWHFLVATYDGSGQPGGIRLYVDGAPVATTIAINVFNGSSILNNSPVTIGARDGGGVPYTGLLDEAAIFGTVLSAASIQQLASDAIQVTKLLPQFAFGGGWYSALYFTNTGNTAVSVPITFTSDSGGPLNIPGVGGSSTTLSLGARATAVIEAPNVGALSQGYVTVSLPGGVTGYGVFRQSVQGIADQEAVVPLSSASSTTSTLIWDDTNYTTAVAIVNPSSIPTTVSIAVRDVRGAVIGTSVVALGARSKTAVILKTLPGLGAMVGNRGSADFIVGLGNVGVLGLRFGGAAFTSIPTTDK